MSKSSAVSVTLFILFLALGILFTALALSAFRRHEVRLVRVDASQSPRGATTASRDRLVSPLESENSGSATSKPAQRSSPLPTMPKRPTAQPPGARASGPQPEAQTSGLQPTSAPKLETTPQASPSSNAQHDVNLQQQTEPAPTISSLEAQSGLPPGVPYASDTDPVRIKSVSLSSDTLRAGDIASARVITTSNAAALTARIGTYQVNVPRVAPGTFALSMTVPYIVVPGHRVVIVVTAIRGDGATTQRSVPLNVYF